MKYDIFKADEDHNHDHIIETFYKYGGNPYIFSRMNLEQSLRILSSEALEMSYCNTTLVPRLINDQIDIFELLKKPNILATIEGDWIKQSAINLLRIKSEVHESNHDLISRINFFPDFIKVDNDTDTANLVEKFIKNSFNEIDELDIKINQHWLSLIESFLSITFHKKGEHDDC